MPSAADTAYELQKQRVVGGAYAPATQLKEEPVAHELGISRTPVRAALKRLVQDGLASFDPGRGVRVAEWAEADIEETYELRSLLEGHAAALAAHRGGGHARASPGDIERRDGSGHPPRRQRFA